MHVHSRQFFPPGKASKVQDKETTMPHPNTCQEVFEVVRDALDDALGLLDDQIQAMTLQTQLGRDLGTESIDLLDIIFRIEKKTGIRLRTQELVPNSLWGNGQCLDSQYYLNSSEIAEIKNTLPFDVGIEEGTGYGSITTIEFLCKLITAHCEGLTWDPSQVRP